MKKNSIYILLLLTLAALTAAPAAMATQGYLDAFNGKYNTDGTRLDTCGVCHVNTNGGGPRNLYGMNFLNNGKNFTSIELLDSDGDGYSNIAEINNLTFPGNPGDHPGQATVTGAAGSVPEEGDGHDGSFDPGSAFYGWEIALENFGETFTFDKSEKLKKQASHASARLSELMAMKRKNNDEAAERALEQYMRKIEQMDSTASEVSDDDSGLLHAEEMIKKHQSVLENLNTLHPDNKGLARAYENSLELQKKFGLKIREKLERKEEHKKDEIKLSAVISNSDTGVSLKVEFTTDSTENLTIAQDILDRVKLTRENIASIIEIKTDVEEEKELKTSLKAEADVKNGITEVEAGYKFALENVTNEDDVINGVYLKLNSLTIENITSVLEIKNKDIKETIKEEKQRIKEQKKETEEQNKELRKETEEQIRESRKNAREQQKEDEEALRETKRQSRSED